MPKYAYSRTSYHIIGRYAAWTKYRVVSRLEVTGYTVDGVPDIGVSKRGGCIHKHHYQRGGERRRQGGHHGHI